MAASSRITSSHLAKKKSDQKSSGPRSDWKRELSPLFDELVADRSSEKEETESLMSGDICGDTSKKGAEVVSKRMSPPMRRMGCYVGLSPPRVTDAGQPMRRMGCQDKTRSPDSSDDVQLMRRMSCTQEKKAAAKGAITI
ncbi:hypothetical protein R1sor_020853 [Riccia sorocarpa]|uniref:Uncharacterized protein n=1 Tax=Riccia sorocarpa TaxID=122646 RepID=A0ABD3GFD5_9MARC